MTLQDAKDLLAWMREEGLVRARVGELELELGSAPSKAAIPAEERQEVHYARADEDPDAYAGGWVPTFRGGPDK